MAIFVRVCIGTADGMMYWRGEMLSEFELDAKPRFDSMAIAHGCVFVTMENGEVVCLSGE